MAKKKTKSKASVLSTEAVAAANAKIEFNLKHDDAVETSGCHNKGNFKSVDILKLSLKSTIENRSSLNVKPRVILTAEDALQLNVRVDDNVILASVHDFCKDNRSNPSNVDTTRIINALLVLPVAIFDEKLISSEYSSPAVMRKDSSHQLPPGTIQLTSPMFRDMLESTSLQKSCTSQNMSVETTLLSKNPTIPPSISFSFKGVVKTPRSSNSKSSLLLKAKAVYNGPTSNHMSGRVVYLVNSKSTLGTDVLRRLSVECSKIVVEVVDVNSKPIDSNGLCSTDESFVSNSTPPTGRIFERLIHAHIAGSFVQHGQVLRIFYAGKPLYVRIVTILPCANDRKSKRPVSESNESFERYVADDISRLSLQDDTKYTSKDSMSLVESLLSCNVKLYQVCTSTKISLECSVGENASMHFVDSYRSHFIQPSPLKQYVVGLSSTIQKIRSFVYPLLTQPEFFAKRGMKAPRGLLLHGPCGVGKTSLAKQLSNEICSEKDKWNCEVRYAHCSSLQSKSSIVGEAEFALTTLFNTVGQKFILIILDDIHLICSRRGSENTETDRLAATLLALVDGIQSTCDNSTNQNLSQTIVFTIAITTNPSVLDPAIRRAGRLDTEVEVPLPEKLSERAAILLFHVKQFDIQVADSLIGESAWLDVAKFAKGFSGADCMLAAKEAVRLALSEFPNSDLKLSEVHLITAIRSIKPSAIKSIIVEIPHVPWSSIGGMDSVKRELREAIELPLTQNEYFQHLKIPPPRGILLYGPPGCSKTLMARALATEGNMNFLAVKGPELICKWLGESERALSSLFRRARMASPSIIFFDEIDAIAASRGNGDSPSSGRLLSQLLTELDGINYTGNAVASNSKKHHRVVVVCATNRPDLLDTALTRPGRIDRMIYVGPPDAASREQILQLHLQNIKRGKDIDVSKLASDAYSAGFSGAEMVAICRDAALLALEEVNNGVRSTARTEEFIDEALPKIKMRHLIAAMQQMQRQITPEMIEFYTSYRESYSVGQQF